MSNINRSAVVGNEPLRALLALALLIIFGLFFANGCDASRKSSPVGSASSVANNPVGEIKLVDLSPLSQRPAAEEFACQWSAEPIVVDGRADEPAWQRATLIEKFMIPVSGKAPRMATRARLLWDADYLYFSAEMDDTDLYADVTEHDGETWLNDVFELFFKPSKSEPGYYELQVNAAGTTMDMYLPCRGAGGFKRFATLDKFGWETAVQLRGTLNDYHDSDQGWTAEGRIPWSDFSQAGGAPKAGDVWDFTVCRYDYSAPHEDMDLSSCSRLSQVNFHRYEDYSLLRFVGAESGSLSAAKPSKVEADQPASKTDGADKPAVAETPAEGSTDK